MRQHAILSCSILCLTWAVLFGYPLLMSVQTIQDWPLRVFLSSVLPFTLLAALHRRERLKNVLFRANFWGFLGIWLLLALRLYGSLIQQPLLARFSICLMIPAAILASLGWRATWTLLFPVMSILWLYPFYESLVQVMESILWYWNAWLLPTAALDWHQASPLQAREQLTPLMTWMPEAFMAIWFYGYFRYSALSQRSVFYTLSIFLWMVLLTLQLLSLSGVLAFAGVSVVEALDRQQFTWLGLGLSMGFLGYVLQVLFPKRPKLKRMMVSTENFRVLVDRHSHWFALTLSALLMMILSVWLSNNYYDLALSVIEGRFF